MAKRQWIGFSFLIAVSVTVILAIIFFILLAKVNAPWMFP